MGGGDYGTSWADIKVLGINQIGTTTAYVAAMLAGSYALRMVPEVASWIMPADAGGGISAAAQGFANATVKHPSKLTVGTSIALKTIATPAKFVAGKVPIVGKPINKTIDKGIDKVSKNIWEMN